MKGCLHEDRRRDGHPGSNRPGRRPVPAADPEGEEKQKNDGQCGGHQRVGQQEPGSDENSGNLEREQRQERTLHKCILQHSAEKFLLIGDSFP
jgi:hypothetical protein